MFGIQHYTSFILAVFVFQLIPGPGTFAILGATARQGIGAGMGAVGGTLTGDLIYMLAAVLGLAALLAAWPGVFAAMQWLGIAYLCWIGWQLLLQPVSDAGAERQQKISVWGHFRTGLAVCLTNPKSVMFFMAFFPLFLDTHADTQTLALLIVHVSLISLAYQSLLVLAGNTLARRLSHIPALRRIATRLAGLALIGFGLRLAFDQR